MDPWNKRRSRFVPLLFAGVAFAVALPRCLDALWGNVPVRFYGRLVDAGGQPVVDARVTYRVSAERRFRLPILWTSGQITHAGTTTTDSRGAFSVEGMRGRSLTVEAVEKPGYKLPGAGGGTYWFDGSVPGTPVYVPDPQRPATIEVVRR